MITDEQEDAYLRKLYEMTEADEAGHENALAIGKKLGFDRELVDEITRRLEEKELVGGLGVAAKIYITPRGKLRVRGVDTEKPMWDFLRQLDKFTESNDPRKESKIAIGESLGYDQDLIEVVTRELFDRKYVILYLGHGIKITEEGIVKARSLS